MHNRKLIRNVIKYPELLMKICCDAPVREDRATGVSSDSDDDDGSKSCRKLLPCIIACGLAASSVPWRNNIKEVWEEQEKRERERERIYNVYSDK